MKIPAHGEWSTEIDVVTERMGAGQAPLEPPDPKRARARMQRNLERWIGEAPRVECDWDPLKATYRRSLVDLAALRFSPPIAGGRALPAAGLPWFMTMFGRDSIFTSLQALPFTPELAATTLRALGDWQGVRLDDFRDEDPGRILHEMRYGEMTAFEERPHSPYFGSVDATPLYVVLLDEYERWTGDRALVRELEIEARAALTWIDEYADLQGTGYIWYRRRNEESGLENQCWKDSWDSISFRDGGLPGFPRATCELQGYAYDAKLRGARLAREIWKDAQLADKLERDAADLKRRFNRDFWVDDGEYFAIALDQDGRQVDSLSSNNGHLLWSGIVDKSKARAVARHLLGPRLFSGWGVRTLAEGEGRYNPIGYHTGTVWPFDNSFVAWGLRRYGFKEEAAEIAAASSTQRRSSTAGCPRRSVAIRASRRSIRCSTRPRAARRRGRLARRSCSCGRCSGSSRTASTSSSIRHCRAPSAISSCSISPAAGVGSTRSAADASTLAERALHARSSPSSVRASLERAGRVAPIRSG